MNKKICIIGAGPSGISAMYSFLEKKNDGINIPEITCYEKQSDIGGLWNFSWQTGTDKNGEQNHCSMYRHLWSNGPKECLEFSNYTFDAHFKKSIPSFPPREVLKDYIFGRIKNTEINEWIQFNNVVKYCEFDEYLKKFKVLVTDFNKKCNNYKYFDYVICCNGHFSTPNIPLWDGMNSFPGRILHSHDFRNAEEMKGLDILIIGTSYSAEDIASQCYKYGVNSVKLSWRTKQMNFKWPENFETLPLLKKIENNICYFINGEKRKIDVIILCTGYIHSFPFLSDELKLITNNRLYPNMLFDGIVFYKNPQLFFIGMQDQWFTFNMFDAQAWYIRDIILGYKKIPDKETMRNNIIQWQKIEDDLDGTDNASIKFQAEYLKYILEQSNLTRFNIDGVVNCFLEWEENKHKNIMTFRDKSHVSLITKTKGTIHSKPWLKEYDDSIKNFCKL